ncbi:hypothetical protein ES677_01490 [Bizionia gelidisalsuginis]|uniref:Lipoprotein n=1 Tax=Bizionia gelidisalsuginis TaxID=291188 RepID=A0ABY3MEP1_9FLAO|nr:hypothetical protein [Bizionia gelidisalsuginis]TYC18079.1 hypothetical protein ES677_01490 [Bizionia gelidisalsuginis]
MKKQTLFIIVSITLSFLSCGDKKPKNNIDKYLENNNIPSLLKDSKKNNDSISSLIEKNALKKFPSNEFQRNSEMKDQHISYDYMKSVPNDSSKYSAQNKFANDYVKQKEEYNKNFIIR